MNDFTFTHDAMSEFMASISHTNYRYVSRRIKFQPARQVFDGVAVATARKPNAANGNLGK